MSSSKRFQRATAHLWEYIQTLPRDPSGVAIVNVTKAVQATGLAQSTVSGILVRMSRAEGSGVRQITPGSYEFRPAARQEAPRAQRKPANRGLQAQVARFMQEHPGVIMGCAEVAERLGEQYGSVATSLRRLSDRSSLSDIHQLSRGVYVYRPQTREGEAGQHASGLSHLSDEQDSRQAASVPAPARVEGHRQDLAPVVKLPPAATPEPDPEMLVFEQIPGTTTSGSTLLRASDGTLWEAKPL